MISLTWQEFIMRIIPEALLLTLGIFMVAGQSVKFKKYLVISTIISITIYLIRKLPIYWGVHTIITIIVIVSIITISGLEVLKSMYSTLLVFFLLSLSEFFNILILKLFNINININSKDLEPMYKAILGIPSLICLGLFILIMYLIVNKKGAIRSVSN